MKEKDNNSKENFSDDPQENLRIENEILKLKMKAEAGVFFGGESADLSPKIENEFLMHVQQFENAWKDVKLVKLYDLIGRPDFIQAAELTDDEIEKELERLLKLMNECNISLDVLAEYGPRIIYSFVTEELFEHETDDMQLPGMTTHFIYEEFHPNHKLDIEENARKFLHHWFEKSFNEYSWELADPFILSDGTIINKEEALKKLNYFFESFSSFSNCGFTKIESDFQWNEEEKKGIGHAEGGVKYNTTMENGEAVHFEGAFKLFMSNENYGWSIFYFVFPGFKW